MHSHPFQSASKAQEYLYARLPFFSRIGAAAYNKSLDKTLALLEALGNPHIGQQFVHVAGTNGKGSTSHMLASVLQASGYNTGLYTSPHLLHVNERFKINGQSISDAEWLGLVNELYEVIERIEPSFFEVTVAMAFLWFQRRGVDISLIEVGLGGRLDSTNVIDPILSIVTHIGLDHKDLLGDTIEKIAIEKAGIIKVGKPVIIGRMPLEAEQVMLQVAVEKGSNGILARAAFDDNKMKDLGEAWSLYETQTRRAITLPKGLKGSYQYKNMECVYLASRQLTDIGWHRISEETIEQGLSSVATNTGLRGRWEMLQQSPRVIADVAHNEDGIREVVAQMLSLAMPTEQVRVVIGMVSDKDHSAVLGLLPTHWEYAFVRVQDNPRALDQAELQKRASDYGLQGLPYPSIATGIEEMIRASQPQDLVLITGSIFVVAEALAYFPH